MALTGGEYGLIGGIVVVSTAAFKLIEKVIDRKKNCTNGELTAAVNRMTTSVEKLVENDIRRQERWTAFMREMTQHFKEFRCLAKDVSSD